MKKLLLILCVISSYTFADGNIVYFTPEEVYSSSKILRQQLSQQQMEYNQQKQALKLKIDQAQQQFDNTTKLSSTELEQLSTKINDLQTQDDKLNNQFTQTFNQTKNNYLTFVKEATQQLYQQNHYSYILNNSAIVITDPNNNISEKISTLADKLYQEQNK